MRIEYYRGDYKYVLKNTATYETDITARECVLPFCSVNATGLLTVQPGYAWDGPSGPTIDTKSSIRGSLIHDALYQILRRPDFHVTDRDHILLRHRSDLILHDILLEDGMWEWRANWWLRGVRAGGGPSAAVKERKVYTAP